MNRFEKNVILVAVIAFLALIIGVMIYSYWSDICAIFRPPYFSVVETKVEKSTLGDNYIAVKCNYLAYYDTEVSVGLKVIESNELTPGQYAKKSIIMTDGSSEEQISFNVVDLFTPSMSLPKGKYHLWLYVRGGYHIDTDLGIFTID